MAIQATYLDKRDKAYDDSSSLPNDIDAQIMSFQGSRLHRHIGILQYLRIKRPERIAGVSWVIARMKNVE